MKFTLRNRFQGLLGAALLMAVLAVLQALGPSAASAKKGPKQQADNLAPAKNDRSVYAEIAKAPEKARARRNPFENDADAVTAGSKLFEQHCAECHGNMAEGGKKGPSLREDEVQSAASGALFWVLTNGVVRRGMPVWSKLPEPQRWQIVSFLKSLHDTSLGPIDSVAALPRR
jgi:mono/diheme cytochrome c family protein